MTTKTAQAQVILEPHETLQTTNAGVVVEITAQLKDGCREEALALMRKIFAYINNVKKNRVTILSFYEVCAPGRLHILLSMSSLGDYTSLRDMLWQMHLPEELPINNWDTFFVEGGLNATVMLPQFRRMYGADDSATEIKPNSQFTGLPPAFNQFVFPLDEIIHSANAGLMIHRQAQLKYEFRSEGRQFAREVVDSINTKARGEACCFLYEEAFGAADRLHWLIHMKDIESYYPLIKMHAMDPEVRELYFRETLPPEKGGGNWSRMFVEGSMVDCAFAPVIW